MSRRRRRDHGQSLVEFSLVLPLLLLLIMGVVDVSRIYFAYLTLEEAVQEGATYATQVTTQPPAVRNPAIVARVQGSSNHAEVTGATVATPVCTNATITVSATYPLPPITPVGSALFGGATMLSATVVGTNFEGTCG
jgi:Flp pilus assembly protein TadG